MTHKRTYEVEVVTLDGEKKTIEMPRISSKAFFDALSDPKVLEATQKNPESGTLVLLSYLIESLMPGLMADLSVASGLELMNTMAEIEIETLSLGEAAKAVTQKKGGRSKKRKA